MSEPLIRARELLLRLGLPADPLRRAPNGDDNIVVLGPVHVVRFRGEGGYDHRREASLSEEALRLEVRAPRCLAAEETWSVWERLPGDNLGRHGTVGEGFWKRLFEDLVRLHSREAPEDAVWTWDSGWLDPLPRISGLTDAEREELVRCGSTKPNVRRLCFAHGDAHEENTMVAPGGEYGGLIDWPDARWWPPEVDYALLRLDGLALALQWEPEPLDWDLVYRLGLMKMVRVVAADLLPLTELRDFMGFWRARRKMSG